MTQRPSRSILIYLLVIAFMVTGYYYFAGRIRSTDSFTYRQFVDALNQSKVEEVLLKPNASGTAGKVIIEMKEGDTYQLYVTDIAQVDTLLRESYGNVNVVVDDIPQDKSFINSALMILATAAIFIFFFAMINRQNGGTNAQMMNFGKSRARMSSPSDTKVTFKDVAGLEEEKQDLEEIVDFLRDPAKYTAADVCQRLGGGIFPKAEFSVLCPFQPRLRCRIRANSRKRSERKYRRENGLSVFPAACSLTDSPERPAQSVLLPARPARWYSDPDTLPSKWA